MSEAKRILNIVKEFQRLKEAESNPLLSHWNAERLLTKANYTCWVAAFGMCNIKRKNY